MSLQRSVPRVAQQMARWLSDKLPGGYERRLLREERTYADNSEVHDLPPIFHYWSHTYVRAMLMEAGADHPDTFFANHLRQSAGRTGAKQPTFLSIGAGNCDTEVRLATRLLESGLRDFEIECLELNGGMLARGRAMAAASGVERHLVFTKTDFNRWRAGRRYDGVMANQSLHHVVQLEHLFDEVRGALADGAWFLASDMIGRNGHQRWPEALEEVRRFWRELPESHHFNHQRRRPEPEYVNRDCSSKGFEGIRSQDVLPELLRRFAMPVFVGFGNVIDVFVDRAFGPNFSVDSATDRAFVDGVHARDEELLASGALTPTHMFAVMSREPGPVIHHSRGLAPGRCVRAPAAR
ncbi:MAG TPA: class I SAM-dependent methyltransferase [Planctomycetota bacterium]|nr:class I SAM-dependent methyltransferase [Planctomycetota bacterium]